MRVYHIRIRVRCLILITLLLTPATVFCQRGSFAVADLRDKAVLKCLFDARMIDGTALWMPNFSEAQEFNVSDDGLCHTILDTILVYGNESLLVFTTSNGDDCHACAPDISLATFHKESDKVWHFERMMKHLRKYGSYGKRQSIRLLKAGKTNYLLRFELSYGSMGEMFKFVNLYELQGYEEVFSSIIYNSFEDPLDKELPYSWDKQFSFTPSDGSSELYDIVLITSGTGRLNKDDEKAPIKTLSGKEIYRYDGDLNRYIRLK